MKIVAKRLSRPVQVPMELGDVVEYDGAYGYITGVFRTDPRAEAENGEGLTVTVEMTFP